MCTLVRDQTAMVVLVGVESQLTCRRMGFAVESAAPLAPLSRVGALLSEFHQSEEGAPRD